VITISPLAAKKIGYLKEEEGRTDQHFLRVEVKKGGCSGLSYKMNFDSESRPGDKTFELGGEKVVVDPESFMYLIGMTLDFEGGLNGKGFIFNNPNAVKACSCGSSFNVAKIS
jgi:iron-sulfur cluster assembly protein